MSLVSVVIPCYNTERFVAEAIEGALVQTHPEVEVVVVDDGSTDGSAAVIDRYSDRVMVVRQANAGLSAARNAGIAAAKGRFIVLCDADDVLLPECVANKLPLLEQEKVGLVVGCVRFMDEAGRDLPDRVDEKPFEPEIDYGTSLRNCIGPPCGWAFPKEAWRLAGGFDPAVRAGEDFDFRLRVGARFRVLLDPLPCARYREVGGSMSRDLTRMVDAHRLLFRKNRSFSPLPAPQYSLGALHGMLNVHAGIFQRALRERVDIRPLIRRRPSALLYLAAWGTRAVFNRTLGRLAR